MYWKITEFGFKPKIRDHLVKGSLCQMKHNVISLRSIRYSCFLLHGILLTVLYLLLSDKMFSIFDGRTICVDLRWTNKLPTNLYRENKSGSPEIKDIPDFVGTKTCQ